MGTNAKLFRAVVVLGAALTAPACEGGHCPTPCPIGDGGFSIDGGIVINDAKRDGSIVDAPVDATPQDVIIII